jgi:hypothetical protein
MTSQRKRPTPSGDWFDAGGGLLLNRRHAHPDVIKGLADGRVVMLLARWSVPGGLAASKHAARDALEAASEAPGRLGIDLRPVMPSLEAMVRRLEDPDETTRSEEYESPGEYFQNTFAVMDLTGQDIPLVIVLSKGPGTKLDKDGRSPVFEFVARTWKMHRPVVAISKRLDREGRESWARAPYEIAVRHANERGQVSLMASTYKGYSSPSTQGQLDRFAAGSDARDQGVVMPEQTRATQLRDTGRKMVDGRVEFHLPGSMRPGFAKTRLKNVDGRYQSSSPIVMFFDDPRWHPHPDERPVELPDVRADNGELVSQVDNVRWVLSVLYRPEWPKVLIAKELMKRRYSTYGIRHKNPGESYETRELQNVVAAIDSIVRNVSLYETGRMQTSVRIGQRREIVTITNCFPPDGKKWATKPDFRRIRAGSATGTERHFARIKGAFALIPCTVNGQAAYIKTLRRLPKTSKGTNELRYGFWHNRTHRETGGDRLVTFHRRVHIPHSFFAQTIAVAIADAGRLPLVHATAPATAQARLTNLEHRVELAQKALDSEEKAQVGRRSVPSTGAFGQDVRDDYERSEAVLIPRLKTALSKAEVAFEAERARQLATLKGAEVARLLECVASLANSHDATHRGIWQNALNDVAFTLTPRDRDGLRGFDVLMTARLRLSANGRYFDVPIRSELGIGGTARPLRRRTELIERLRAGDPVRGERGVVGDELLPGVAALLGISATRFPLGMCDDPALLRLGMAVAFPVDPPTSVRGRRRQWLKLASDPELKETFADPETLIRRIWDLHSPPGPRHNYWLRQSGEIMSRALIVASQNDGRLSSDLLEHPWRNTRIMLRDKGDRSEPWDFSVWGEMTLRPCPFCGGLARAPMRIYEAVGLLCLAPSCRRDSTGVRWPADPYDKYIGSVHLWVDAGLVAPVVPAEAVGWTHVTENHPGRRGGKRKKELTKQEERLVVRDYQHSPKAVTEVADDHCVTLATLYTLVDQYGVPRRRPTMRSSSRSRKADAPGGPVPPTQRRRL